MVLQAYWQDMACEIPQKRGEGHGLQVFCPLKTLSFHLNISNIGAHFAFDYLQQLNWQYLLFFRAYKIMACLTMNGVLDSTKYSSVGMVSLGSRAHDVNTANKEELCMPKAFSLMLQEDSGKVVDLLRKRSAQEKGEEWIGKEPAQRQ